MSPWHNRRGRWTFTTDAGPEAIAIAKRMTRDWLTAIDVRARDLDATLADHWPAFLEMARYHLRAQAAAHSRKFRRAEEDSEGFSTDPVPGSHPAGKRP